MSRLHPSSRGPGLVEGSLSQCLACLAPFLGVGAQRGLLGAAACSWIYSSVLLCSSSLVTVCLSVVFVFGCGFVSGHPNPLRPRSRFDPQLPCSALPP